ncbi:hypothetical protein BDF21DRAFT_429247 [Thamnidium elegans]|nr:hypothetical protein BDF21DRAFT_429247 [Thamnidium elegans]
MNFFLLFWAGNYDWNHLQHDFRIQLSSSLIMTITCYKLGFFFHMGLTWFYGVNY